MRKLPYEVSDCGYVLWIDNARWEDKQKHSSFRGKRYITSDQVTDLKVNVIGPDILWQYIHAGHIVCMHTCFNVSYRETRARNMDCNGEDHVYA